MGRPFVLSSVRYPSVTVPSTGNATPVTELASSLAGSTAARAFDCLSSPTMLLRHRRHQYFDLVVAGDVLPREGRLPGG